MEVKRVEEGRTLVKMKGLRPRRIMMKDSMQRGKASSNVMKRQDGRHSDARGSHRVHHVEQP
jgi:hypothetical protein